MLGYLYTDYLNVRYSFIILVLHCNYYPYLTNLCPEIRKMISGKSSLHASSNTCYHSHSNGSWSNAPEEFVRCGKARGDRLRPSRPSFLCILLQLLTRWDTALYVYPLIFVCLKWIPLTGISLVPLQYTKFRITKIHHYSKRIALFNVIQYFMWLVMHTRSNYANNYSSYYCDLTCHQGGVFISTRDL